ncbi:MAG: trigger factor [Ignavibacteria bacterium]|nr:trigger factor [Ignavibacteria bacterium]
MEVSITDITDVEKEILIQATADELAPHFEKAYRRYQAKIEIRGFRKGKAPIDLVKKIHGESIEYNSLDTVASDVYRQVVEQNNIKPIGEPVLTDIDYKRGELLTFKIKYEVKPKVELKEYKGISVEKVIHRVTDKEVEDEILRLRKSNSTIQETDVARDDEHIITADIQELDDAGTPIIGRKSADAKLYLADETLYPQIREALRDSAVEMVRRVKVDHEHDGKKHSNNLDITVKKVEKVLLPELNDEFIKNITKEKATSVDEFLKQLRDDLETYWKERTDRKLTDTLIGEIVHRHEVTVPDSLVKGMLESLFEEVKNRYPNKKLPPDFSEEKFRETNKGYATFQARWYLIRECIINTEGITVDDKEIEHLAEIDAPKMGIDKERLLQFYRTSGTVKDRILSDKLMTFLLENQVVTERVTEDTFD